MNKILATLLLGILMVPAFAVPAHAQEVTVDAQLQELKTQLIALLTEQVNVLLAQIKELKDAQAATNARLNGSVGGDTEDAAVEEFDVDIAVSVGESRDEDGRARVTLTSQDDADRVLLQVIDSSGHVRGDYGELDAALDLDPGKYTWELVAYQGGHKSSSNSKVWVDWTDKVEKSGSFTVSE